jgi:hypothetical protein
VVRDHISEYGPRAEGNANLSKPVLDLVACIELALSLLDFLSLDDFSHDQSVTMISRHHDLIPGRPSRSVLILNTCQP